jgi:hypothetical protein
MNGEWKRKHYLALVSEPCLSEAEKVPKCRLGHHLSKLYGNLGSTWDLGFNCRWPPMRVLDAPKISSMFCMHTWVASTRGISPLSAFSTL